MNFYRAIVDIVFFGTILQSIVHIFTITTFEPLNDMLFFIIIGLTVTERVV